LTENKRVLTCLNSDDFGQVLVLEVGATCVGSIINTYDPNVPMMKGDEKGYFSFGGSAVITLFERNRIQLDEDLLKHSSEGRELYAQMGDRLGSK
jgi:phosphatidylserine decarboxylase